MRVTQQLVDYVNDYQAKNDLSYSEMGRRTNMSWSSWARLCQGTPKTISPEMVDAICQLTGVDEISLIDIAEGRTPVNHLDPKTIPAMALWRWLDHHDHVGQRCGVLRALGYSGILPDESAGRHMVADEKKECTYGG